MDAIDLLRHQIIESYDWLDLTVSDITQEQANWRPPGKANSIGSTYAHLIITADVGFNSQLHGGMPVMATRFRGRVGLSEMPHAAGGWHDWNALTVDWQQLKEYGHAIRQCIEQRLASLSPEELELSVDMRPHGLGMWKGLDVYDLHGNKHVRLHGGEIACLKGMQGARGYLGGADAPDLIRVAI